jgi:hypothetical protein
VTVTTAGRYSIEGVAQIRGLAGAVTNNHEAVQLVVNGGVIVATFAARDIDSSVVGKTLPISWEGNLVAGDTVDLRVRYASATTVDVYRVNLNIRQVPTATVVDPGTVPVTPVTTCIGYFDAGDINIGANPVLPVGGNVVSAAKAAISDSGNVFSVVIPNMGNTTYPLWFTFESLGTLAADNDAVGVKLIKNKTATGFDLQLIEGSSSVQNLRVHVYATSTFTSSTVVQPGSVPVSQTNTTYRRRDIGNTMELWFQVASVADNDQVLTFPVAFASAPSLYDVQLSMQIRAVVAGGSAAVRSVSATTVTVNRDDGVNDTDDPWFSVYVIGPKP